MDKTWLDADTIFDTVMKTPQVKAKVWATAQKVARQGRRHTIAAGGKAEITIRENPLPSGRYSVDVVSDTPGEEYGSSEHLRIRALRRAAREVKRG